MQGDNRFYIKCLVFAHEKVYTNIPTTRQLCVHFELIFCSSISDIGDSILAHAYAKLPYHHKLLQKRSIRNALRTKLEKRHKTYAYFSVSETATTISVGNNMYFFQYPRALIHPMQPYF